MGVSATTLGKSYGLDGQEMNAVLVELGYLSGTPGDYFPTEKGLPFITEEDHHRGNGGYARYNRYWTTRTYDPGIKRVLNITPELIEKVRADLMESRIERQQARIAAQAEADALFQAKLATEKQAKEASEAAAKRAAENAVKFKKTGIIALVVICTAGVGYAIYKLIPIIKKKLKQLRRK